MERLSDKDIENLASFFDQLARMDFEDQMSRQVLGVNDATAVEKRGQSACADDLEKAPQPKIV